jgi:CelD/BcsL family acetyltransferase involved in cellulose biosynthesis
MRVTSALPEVVEDLGSLRDDWIRLGEASGNIFASWEFSSLWWQHFGSGRRLAATAYRNEVGEVVAITPLYVWRERPLRVVRLIGHGHGDLLGPICSRDDDELAVEALRLALGRQRYDVFVGDWVPADRDWALSLGARVLREAGYPIVRLDDASWEEFLASRSRRFRKAARSSLRRLEREHDVRFRLSDRASLERDLDAAFALHRARFKNHENCYFCGEKDEAFHREFAASALERGRLRLWILEVDGEPVGSDYSFRFADAHFAYQGGRNPAWDRESVGSILELHAIRNAMEEGAREYRFLQGDESYKYRFTDEDPGLETIAVGGTAVGRMAVTGAAGLRRLPPLAAIVKRISR